MGWGIVGDLADGAKKAAGGAADFVGDTAKAAGEKFDDAVDDVKEVIDDAVDTAGDVARGVGKAVSNASISDIGHTALDVAGMVPVIGEAADLANAGWYLAEGDKANAALSAAGAIPFAGNAATAAKWGKKAVDAADVIGDAAKVVDKAGSVAKGADKLGDTAKVTDKAGTSVKAIDEVGDGASTAAHGASDAASAGRVVSDKVGKNEFTWKYNSKDGSVEASATIKEVFSGAKRSSSEISAQKNLPGKIAGDHAGHIIAHRFSGDQGVKNLFPQNGNFNTSAYKKVENEISDWVKHKPGNQVDVNVKLSKYTDGRPERVKVEYTPLDSAGNQLAPKRVERFKNESGQVYDRIPKNQLR